MTLTLTATERPAIKCANGDAGVIWTIPVKSLLILAEYTNPHGPMDDDYFLVFGYREKGQCYFNTATFYALGTELLLAQLSSLLRCELRFGLCHSTDWNSRVIWPPKLVDQEFFIFTRIGPKSIWQSPRAICLGPGYHCSMAAEVNAYLDGASGS